MLPSNLISIINLLELHTAKNSRSRLTICFAYTSRHELCGCLKSISEKVLNQQLHPSEIDLDIVEKELYTYGSGNPDLLIRTSGESRLSDFLLWQSSETRLEIVPVLWPDFSFWHFTEAVLNYQCEKLSINHFCTTLMRIPLKFGQSLKFQQQFVSK